MTPNRKRWIAIGECLLLLVVFVLMGLGLDACRILVETAGHSG